MPHGPVGVKVATREAGNARRFLTAMLERVEAKGHDGSGAFGAMYSKDAAFFAQLVPIVEMSFEWMCREHQQSCVGGVAGDPIRRGGAFVAHLLRVARCLVAG
jgi:hypothetical protein